MYVVKINNNKIAIEINLKIDSISFYLLSYKNETTKRINATIKKNKPNIKDLNSWYTNSPTTRKISPNTKELFMISFFNN